MIAHLTLATRGRTPLWTTPSGLGRLVASLMRVAGPDLLLFGLVDDHAHVVVDLPPDAAAARTRVLNKAWRTISGQPLVATDLAWVEDRAHLLHLVAYVHRQPLRHGLDVHPAAWAGSSLWDLLEARRLPGFPLEKIRGALPRLSEEHLRTTVGLPPRPTVVAASEGVQILGVRGTLDACVAAIAGQPSRNAFTAARAVAVRAALEADVRPRKIAADLQVDDRSVRRLRDVPVEPATEVAALRQVSLRCELRGAAPVQPNESELRALDRARLLSGSRSHRRHARADVP